VALSDLGLDELLVVKPGGRDFAMGSQIRAMSLRSALMHCEGLL
jgi:hypothetical protein